MLPAGKYYIGDPCYVFSNEDWDQVIDIKYQDRDKPKVEFEFKGHPMWVNFTAFGDSEACTSKRLPPGLVCGALSLDWSQLTFDPNSGRMSLS